MAAQVTPVKPPPAVLSAAAAFPNAAQRSFAEALVKELYELRNVVDALTTAYNLVVTAANATATKYNALATKYNAAAGKYNTLATLFNAFTATRTFSLENVAAAVADGVHAAFAGNDASNDFPGAFTNPVVPRNVTVTFGATWDGGDVTVVGTDQFDAAVSETIADNPGSAVAGVKIFKTVTSATKEAVGAAAGTASIGTGDKLGIAADVVGAFGALLVGTTPEAVTVDATYDAFTPTTVPDGAVDYTLMVNVNTSNGATDAAVDGATDATTNAAAGVAPASVTVTV